MQQPKDSGFADRLTTAAEAKKALLAKMKPKPTVIDPDLVDRNKRREEELHAVREQRTAEKEAARIAKAAAAEAARLEYIASGQAAIEAKKNERKERKANQKMDAQSRRASRLEAYGKLKPSSSDADVAAE